MGTTKTPSVMPREMSVTISTNTAFSPVLYRNLLGLTPLKWWQRLYIWLRWGRKIRKAHILATRIISKSRMTFQYLYGFDPFDLEEDENAEEE